MRFDIDSFRETADSLTRNRRRTILTGFGVFWGLFMLLFMIGGGQGLKGLLEQNFGGFASNTIVLISSNTSKPYKGLPEGRYWEFTRTDIDRLKQMVPELDVVSPMISGWGSTVEYGEYSTSAAIKGVSADYCKIEQPKLRYGRYINQTDINMERKVCVIGRRVYQSLFPDGGDPCGKFVKYGDLYFRIVGVDMSSSNISINSNSSYSIIIPETLAATIYNRGNVVDIICVTAKGGIHTSVLEPRIRSIIARQHSFDPEDLEAMQILNTEEVFMLVDNLFRGLNFLIWLVGLGTLLAGCIGVSNIMMVTVKERTTEIGIRRAIGAMPGEILTQIIMESVALTLAAGTAGIVFAVFLLNIFQKIASDAQFLISFNTAIMAALLLAVLGAVAGLAPALRAMAVKPVDAMRDE
ncbi:MAG: ABC transporter permease [Bacteroidaceae bacterium]|nr:ABC transporter permease [Bacteroidaceae bacterium]MBR6857235.1 ABC transporter permease [Bacteroidaceae bacterium]